MVVGAVLVHVLKEKSAIIELVQVHYKFFFLLSIFLLLLNLNVTDAGKNYKRILTRQEVLNLMVYLDTHTIGMEGIPALKQGRRRGRRQRHLKIQYSVSAIISQLDIWCK